MKIVYLLQHLREEDDYEDIKLIGIFSSEDKANESKKKHACLPGFNESPEGFSIDEYKIDQDFWNEGFGIE